MTGDATGVVCAAFLTPHKHSSVIVTTFMCGVISHEISRFEDAAIHDLLPFLPGGFESQCFSLETADHFISQLVGPRSFDLRGTFRNQAAADIVSAIVQPVHTAPDSNRSRHFFNF